MRRFIGLCPVSVGLSLADVLATAYVSASPESWRAVECALTINVDEKPRVDQLRLPEFFSMSTSIQKDSQIGLDYLLYIVCVLPIVVSILGFSSYLFIGDTQLFNLETYLYSILLSISSIIVIYVANYFNSGVLLVVVFFGNMFVFPRLLQFILTPSIVYFPFPAPLTVEEVNAGILAYIATLVVLAAGAIVAVFSFPARSLPQQSDGDAFLAKKKYFVFAVFLLFLLIELAIQNSAGMQEYKSTFEHSDSVPVYIKIILTLVSSDMVLFYFVFLAFATSGRGLSVNNIILLALAVTIFVFWYAVLGSRGSGIRVMLFLIACAFSINWRSTRYAIQIVSLAAFAGLATAALYPLAEGFRQGGDFEQAQLLYSQPTLYAGQDAGRGIIVEHAINILNRLANFDYVAVTATRDAEPGCVAKYMTPDYAAKNIVNQFAPGDPFPEARVSTSNVFRLCYGERDKSELTYYHSEIWTLLGLARIYFGGFALLACAGVGFVLQLIANLLRRSSHEWIRASYGFYLFIVPISVFYTMGVDHTFNTIAISYIRLFIALSAVQVLVWMYKWSPGIWRSMSGRRPLN